MTEKIIEHDKINEILFPFLSQGFDALKSTGNKFVHYTSASNVINILRSKQLWLRSANCMNDYMELEYGYRKLIGYFEKNTTYYKEKLNHYDQELYNDTLEQFDSWWKNIESNTYIASMSVHHPEEDYTGRLSMWRAYGNTDANAAIVINNPTRVDNLNAILSPALYLNDIEFENLLNQILNNFQNNIEYLRTLDRNKVKDNIFFTLLTLALTLKHPGFKEEQEWRIIYLPSLPQHNNAISSDVEVISGIPQVVYKLPLENLPEYEINNMSLEQLIGKVIIGPSKYPYMIYKSLSIEMTNAGISNSENKINTSSIPLRT